MERLDALSTLRDDIAGWLQDCPVDRKAALIAQYRATLAEITALTPEQVKVGDPVDEIARRRAARGAGTTKDQGRPKSGAR